MKYLIGFILLILLLPHCSKGAGRVDQSGEFVENPGFVNGGDNLELDPSTKLDSDPRLAVECQQSGGQPIGTAMLKYRPELGRTTGVYYFDRCKY